MPSDEKIKASILLSLGSHRYKLARILGQVSVELNIVPELVEAVVISMLANDQLLSFGELKNWRHCEVQNPNFSV